MVARLVDVPWREISPLVRDLSDAGFDDELAALIRKPGNAAIAVQLLRERFVPRVEVAAPSPPIMAPKSLIDRCTTIPAQTELAARMHEQHWKCFLDSDALFRQLEATRPDWPSSPTQIATLAIVLPGLPKVKRQPAVSSVTRSFEEHWRLGYAAQKAIEGNNEPWRWEGVLSGRDQLRLVRGVSCKPDIRWVYLDTDPNPEERRAQKRSSELVRQMVTPQQLPTVAVLALPWLHPALIPAMNGDTIPYMDMAGYELDVRKFCPDDPAWSHVPYLYFNVDSRQMKLSVNRCGSASPRWFVPLQEECQN